MLSIRSLGRLLGSLVCLKVNVSEPALHDRLPPAAPASLEAPPHANASDRLSATTVDPASGRMTSEPAVAAQERRVYHPTDEASSDDSPSPRLPPELLLAILEHVLADESGRDALTRVCRTSKDMRQLAEPLLYRDLSFEVLVCRRRILCHHDFQCLSPPGLSLTQEQAVGVCTLKLKVVRISCDGQHGRSDNDFLPTLPNLHSLAGEPSWHDDVWHEELTRDILEWVGPHLPQLSSLDLTAVGWRMGAVRNAWGSTCDFRRANPSLKTLVVNGQEQEPEVLKCV
ncbi:F-box domain-containing protein [Rhodotorula toruloides]|uniref:F-box domain-containing protein n=1 Tax=Rhodotorula toruloides TaxID=5286 RepID=A0A2T0A8X8_RHOTO|nr:F-box domain-containing protein [Rhodotorula toruloides]PRQ74463.1 hypothetical protein AAT19DRAFT_14816 [Rhodotorula toruloides]